MGNEAFGAAENSGAQGLGVTAEAAAQQRKGAADPVEEIGRENASAAGVQKEADLNREFESLIKGKFKAQYDARMQDTIQKRLRGSKDAADRWKEAAPILEMLGKKYGIDASDLAALSGAVASEESKTPDSRIRENADRLHAAWRQQEQETGAVYPAFSMEQELRNPTFVKLITNDVDVRTAYEVLHSHEIIPAAMEFAAQAVEQNLAKKIAANGARPAENAMGAQASVMVRQDVSRLTKSEINDVARRVARGERVSFG